MLRPGISIILSSRATAPGPSACGKFALTRGRAEYLGWGGRSSRLPPRHDDGWQIPKAIGRLMTSIYRSAFDLCNMFPPREASPPPHHAQFYPPHCRVSMRRRDFYQSNTQGDGQEMPRLVPADWVGQAGAGRRGRPTASGTTRSVIGRVRRLTPRPGRASAPSCDSYPSGLGTAISICSKGALCRSQDHPLHPF
jgi:hypothetical protein